MPSLMVASLLSTLSECYYNILYSNSSGRRGRIVKCGSLSMEIRTRAMVFLKHLRQRTLLRLGREAKRPRGN